MDTEKGLVVIIAGTRTIKSIPAVKEAIRAASAKWAEKGYWIREVYHGQAAGADTIGASLAAGAGLKVTAFPPKWNDFGKAAGMRRNEEMLKAGAQALIAVWDGTSRGTNGMIRMAGEKLDAFFIHIHRVDLTAAHVRNQVEAAQQH